MTRITRKPYGRTPAGQAVELFTLCNAAGSSVDIITYGARVAAIRVPDRAGNLADVVLGHDSLEGYLTRKAYFGAVVGRCANRIGGARFELGGRTVELAANEGKNHIHGGISGFDDKVWEAAVGTGPDGDRLILRLSSPDGEEHYPGNLSVSVTYAFSDQNELTLHYQAVCDADTVCNLTNHSYFNLGGYDSGDILAHRVRLHAERFTPSDVASIPTGEIREVAGTPMDFRQFYRVGERIDADYDQLRQAHGYDHNWIISGEGMRPCAEVVDDKSGRRLVCRTTSPCMQFYTGNYLGGLTGKGGLPFRPRTGLCLETQFAPDAIHHPDWHSPILRAGESFDQTTAFRFDTVPME